MFQIGDIVRPKREYIGNDFQFKIKEIEIQPFSENSYKLERSTQTLDIPKNDIAYALSIIIKGVENSVWRESELELTSNVKLRYAKTNINVPWVKFTQELTKQNKIDKEENIMDILDLYEERKLKSIREEYSESEKNVKENDEIQKIIIEMTNQVNTILENQGTEARYTHLPSLYTPETVEKLDELDKKLCETIEKLRSTLEEIRALFELTDDYNERIKILKNYDILDKKGKLNV